MPVLHQDPYLAGFLLGLVSAGALLLLGRARWRGRA